MRKTKSGVELIIGIGLIIMGFFIGANSQTVGGESALPLYHYDSINMIGFSLQSIGMLLFQTACAKVIKKPKINIDLCPFCGNKISNGDIFCRQCGNKLSASGTVQEFSND